MSDDKKQWTFKAEDIFKNIPGDDKNVEMKIPEEVADAIGLLPGDKVRVLWGDQGTIKIEKVEENNGEKEQAKEST